MFTSPGLPVVTAVMAVGSGESEGPADAAAPAEAEALAEAATDAAGALAGADPDAVVVPPHAARPMVRVANSAPRRLDVVRCVSRARRSRKRGLADGLIDAFLLVGRCVRRPRRARKRVGSN